MFMYTVKNKYIDFDLASSSVLIVLKYIHMPKSTINIFLVYKKKLDSIGAIAFSSIIQFNDTSDSDSSFSSIFHYGFMCREFESV